jgi:hypothetical protein
MARTTRSRAITVGAALLIALGLITVITTHPHTTSGEPSTTTSAPVPVPATGTGVYWGIQRDPFTYGGNSSLHSRESIIDGAEQALGRKFDIDHEFFRWGEALPTPYLRWTASDGRIPFISLIAKRSNNQLVQWADIADGKQDHYLRSVAAGLKRWGVPAFFSFHHEPEHAICPGDDASTCDRSQFNGTVADYVGAWRHIVTLFRSLGVRHVSYVWITTGYRYTDPSDYRYGPKLYPGNDYIDWIGSDPYNFPAAKDGVVDMSRWQSLADIITPWYRWAESTGKPLMLSEFGCRTDPAEPDRRAQWFAQAEHDIKADFPLIKAMDYYDNYPRAEPNNDWRLFTGNDPAGLAAFKAWGLDPYYDIRH